MNFQKTRSTHVVELGENASSQPYFFFLGFSIGSEEDGKKSPFDSLLKTCLSLNRKHIFFESCLQ